MCKSKPLCAVLSVAFAILFIFLFCGFASPSDESQVHSGKQKVSTLSGYNEKKQEVTPLAMVALTGCTYQVRRQVEKYYKENGYKVTENIWSTEPNTGEDGRRYTFKCVNNEELFPEYRKITVNYVGNSETRKQGLCAVGETCSTEIYSLISIQTDSITGCNYDVRMAVENYYASKGVYVVKNPKTSDDNTFSNGSKYSFKCENDSTAFPGYKQIIATYIGNYKTNMYNICKTGAVCHTTIWSNADLGIDDVTLDIDEGRFIVSGLMHDDRDAWNITFDSIQEIIVGITGLGVLACVLAFVLQFIRLGATAGNPAERERVLKGIIWTGIGAVGCGAVTLIFSFAFNIL